TAALEQETACGGSCSSACSLLLVRWIGGQSDLDLLGKIGGTQPLHRARKAFPGGVRRDLKDLCYLSRRIALDDVEQKTGGIGGLQLGKSRVQHIVLDKLILEGRWTAPLPRWCKHACLIVGIE